MIPVSPPSKVVAEHEGEDAIDRPLADAPLDDDEGAVLALAGDEALGRGHACFGEALRCAGLAHEVDDAAGWPRPLDAAHGAPGRLEEQAPLDARGTPAGRDRDHGAAHSSASRS
jgi:hypothetical protein